MHRIFMKHFGFMAMLFFASIEVADGQAMIQVIPVEPEDETLIGSQPSIGWFGGPVLKFSEINDECAFFTGGCGGLVLNHTLIIGGAGYGLANEIEVNEALYPEFRLLEMGYGGVVLGYVNRSRKAVHLSFHSLIGAGGLSYRSHYYDYRHDDIFFVAEPGIDLELNLTRYFRLGCGATYRLVRGVDIDGLTDEALSGPSATLTFKIGRF
jgi:hypothetical protein